MSKKNLSDAVTAELLDDDRDSTSTDTLSRDYESKHGPEHKQSELSTPIPATEEQVTRALSEDSESTDAKDKRFGHLGRKRGRSDRVSDGQSSQQSDSYEAGSNDGDDDFDRDSKRPSTAEGKPRRQWNRENARRSRQVLTEASQQACKSLVHHVAQYDPLIDIFNPSMLVHRLAIRAYIRRMRKRLLVESMAVRMEKLRGEVLGMRAMIGRAGLEEDWQAWAQEHAAKYVHPSRASMHGLSSIEMPGEPGKVDHLAIAEVARKAVEDAVQDGEVDGAAEAEAAGAAARPRVQQSTSSSMMSQPKDGMVMVDGSLVPQSLMAPRGIAQATQLHATDYALIDSINTARRRFLITDPLAPDNPIVFASSGFFGLTQYPPSEVLGRNCRMLQGPETDPTAVDEIRAAVRTGSDAHVVLLNYRRDGTPFWNDLFVAPLRDPDGNVVHFVGVQCEVTPSRARALLQLKAQAKAKTKASRHARSLLAKVDRGMAATGPLHMAMEDKVASGGVGDLVAGEESMIQAKGNCDHFDNIRPKPSSAAVGGPTWSAMATGNVGTSAGTGAGTPGVQPLGMSGGGRKGGFMSRSSAIHGAGGETRLIGEHLSGGGGHPGQLGSGGVYGVSDLDGEDLFAAAAAQRGD